MELVISFLGELLLDGCFELISSKRISKPIRWGVFIFVCAFYLFLIGMFVVFMSKISNLWINLFLLVVAGIIIVQLARLFIRLIEWKKEKN